MTPSTDNSPTADAPINAGAWNYYAAVIAVGLVAGSLWLSLGLALKACPLCLYQRTFVMSAAGVLGIGMLTQARRTGLPCLLALPATAGGLCVAAFHTYLESIGRLECPAGIFGWGTAPQQALAGILVLAGAIGIGATRGRREIHYGFLAVVVAIVVGVLLGWSAIRSAPPMPPVPAQRYESRPDVCRPPFRSP